ncbi:hypothetical protein, conserved [Eimeria brunetti]|uniref:Uncharacterized protein n=1 Tax=Eimeria brunetti TaxID=51314 RepID=U6LU05_9EIME|nr:hypothetical protein, conserved [Eimeria brunetti]
MRRSRSAEQTNATQRDNEAYNAATRTQTAGRAPASTTASLPTGTDGGEGAATTRRPLVSTSAAATSGAGAADAATTASAGETVQRKPGSATDKKEENAVEGTAAAAAAAREGRDSGSPSRSGEQGSMQNRRERGGQSSARRVPLSSTAAPAEDQTGVTQLSTTPPNFSVGITTAFSFQNSRGQIDSSSNRGRAFRGHEAAAEDSEEFTEEEGEEKVDEKTCTLGHCPSSEFLGTAATPTAAAAATGQSSSSDYIGGFLGRDLDEGKDPRSGILQPEHFTVDTEEDSSPQFEHGIIPDPSPRRLSSNLQKLQRRRLAARRLSERPAARGAAAAGGSGGGSERGGGAAGGGDNKPSDAKGAKPEAKGAGKKGEKEEEEDPYEEYPDHCGDLATFIEGRQVVEWDIPIFNGIVHVLGSSVLRPDIEAIATEIAFWQCTHQFCFECPLLTPFLLKFLDKIGIITGKKPFEFMPPPGVRPDWVCRGAFDYYPAGWTKQTWLKYLETMHSGDKRIMKRNADLVARAAYERHQIALLYESVRLQSIEARKRYDPLRPINDPFYDPQYKNMKKAFDEKNFECKGEAVNRELTHKQMHKILPAVYPWKG